MAYVPHSEADIRDMLATIGVARVSDLFDAIPRAVRSSTPLDVPPALPEWSVVQEVTRLAQRNSALVCFAGGGIYDHYAPSAVNHVLLRSEWYTAYTPYQPEVAQGSLQLIYEFQTMIAELFGMDVANASMYDGATAAAEAVVLALGVQAQRSAAAVAKAAHPHTRQVVATAVGADRIKTVPFTPDGRVDLMALREAVNGAACFLVQQPNFFGVIEDLDAVAAATREAGALLVVSADPVAMAVLKSPGSQGADLVVGEGQGLGIAPSFGGPVVGLFAANQKYLRQMPGRLAGATVDRQGRRGFVLTLQAREQQIRREKATSNICTNQALLALAATVHLALLGRQGLRHVAERSLENAHRAFDAVTALPGFEPLVGGPFFKEFAVRTPKPARSVLAHAASRGVLAGVALSRFPGLVDHEALLIAVTEKRSDEEIDRLVDALKTA